MTTRVRVEALVIALVLCAAVTKGKAANQEPIDGISDNSFLVEEAYNQEPGVVQHIFNAVYLRDPHRHGWPFNFTQEWPLFSVQHQLSYSIVSSYLWEEGQLQSGLGDILINYRYQALEEGSTSPAFAPRFSLILPTGSRDNIAVRSPLQLGTHLPPQSARAVGFAGQSTVPQTFACLI